MIPMKPLISLILAAAVLGSGLAHAQAPEDPQAPVGLPDVSASPAIEPTLDLPASIPGAGGELP